MLWTPEQDALADWLEKVAPWSHFATWTFGKAWPAGPTLPRVQDHVTQWLDQHQVNSAFFVAERGWTGVRRWHAHGLLSGQGTLDIDLDGQTLWRDWSRRYGRCRFDPVDAQDRCVRAYCSKYCFKGGLSGCRWWIRTGGMPF